MAAQERPHKRTCRRSSLAGSIGDLLSNGKYSDLEIRCDGKRFEVHRNIVCGRSTVMDRECDGGFLEAQTRIIKHSVFDSSAMDRMLQFMYRCDYQMQQACPTLPDPDARDEDTTSQSSPVASTSGEESAVISSVVWNVKDELIAHTYVYAIADYYEMPALQDLAASKFAAVQEGANFLGPEGLIEVASIVYANTTAEATDLRHQMFWLVWDNQWSSFESQLFMDALAARPELQEFAVEIISKSITNHRADDQSLEEQIESLQASIDRLEQSDEMYEVSDRCLRTKIGSLEEIIDRYEQAEVRTSSSTEALEKELNSRRRDIQDLTYFASIEHCRHCVSEGSLPRFSYTLKTRTRDRGYAAICTGCKKRHTRLDQA